MYKYYKNCIGIIGTNNKKPNISEISEIGLVKFQIKFVLYSTSISKITLLSLVKYQIKFALYSSSISKITLLK